MTLATKDKKKIITEFQTTKGDTGSPEIQVALLTERIKKLTGHLKSHIHDIHSRRGLLSMVSKRRRLLSYVLKKNEGRYKSLVTRLALPK